MTQLVINGVILPETSKNKYRCYPAELRQTVDMISGRRVNEIRGFVQMIEYSYDYMGAELGNTILQILRSGKPISVGYLPDNSDTIENSEFWVESLTPPSFAFSKKGVPYWHNLAFILREVKPHD